jgi:hypothetical protein
VNVNVCLPETLYALRDTPSALTVVNRSRRRRIRLTSADRLLWAGLSRAWRSWRTALVIIKPATVVTWHRRAFRLYWTWKSRQRTDRPGVPFDVQTLIRGLSIANPLWGAPRLHGELQKLGISISQSTVAKFMLPRHPRPPSQTWRTFLTNHAGQIMAARLARSRRRSPVCASKLGLKLEARRNSVDVFVIDHAECPKEH